VPTCICRVILPFGSRCNAICIQAARIKSFRTAAPLRFRISNMAHTDRLASTARCPWHARHDHAVSERSADSGDVGFTRLRAEPMGGSDCRHRHWLSLWFIFRRTPRWWGPTEQDGASPSASLAAWQTVIRKVRWGDRTADRGSDVPRQPMARLDADSLLYYLMRARRARRMQAVHRGWHKSSPGCAR
jgi:hypothetical protein